MGLPLPIGSDTIELSYLPPCFGETLFISLTSTMALRIMAFVTKRSHKENHTARLKLTLELLFFKRRQQPLFET